MKTYIFFASTSLTFRFFFLEIFEKLAGSEGVRLILVSNFRDVDMPFFKDWETFNISFDRDPRPLRDLYNLLKVINFLSAHRAATVVTVAPKVGLLVQIGSKILRVKTSIHIFQGEVWQNLTGLKKKLLILCDSITGLLASRVFCVSRSERNLLLDNLFFKVDPQVLGAGAIRGVPELWSRLPYEHRRLMVVDRREPLRLLFMGRINADKGLSLLLTTLTNLSLSDRARIKLQIVGPEDGYLDQLRHEIDFYELEEVVSVEGGTDSPELYYMNSDVLLNLSEREGFGNVVIEAAFFGVPCIGRDIVGLRDSIKDGKTGILLTSPTPELVADTLRQLLRDRQYLMQMGKSARSHAIGHYRGDLVRDRWVDAILNSKDN